ncbi:MAG: hypothetical protein F4Y41_05445 [Gammaproteobacteria bacterium]|nr:hypothetical protein [Gammaproteobacteria bacterium]
MAHDGVELARADEADELGDLHEADARIDAKPLEHLGIGNQDPALVDVAGDELDLERLAPRLDAAGDRALQATHPAHP